MQCSLQVISSFTCAWLACDCLQGWPYIFAIALYDIPPGHELTYTYARTNDGADAAARSDFLAAEWRRYQLLQTKRRQQHQPHLEVR